MKKRNGHWWVFALAAVCCWALGLAWIPLHLESPDGLDVMAALVLLANAVIWTLRGMYVFHRREKDNIYSANDNMIDGGDKHE